MRLHPLNLLVRTKRDERGATAVEFALVAGAFFMLLLGVIEFGLVMFSKVAIESALQQSARDVGIGRQVAGCSDRACSIMRLVEQRTASLPKSQSVKVTATVANNSAVPSPSIPDVCLDDPNVPYPATCSVFENNNGTLGYQPTGALGNVSIGNAGDMIEVRVTYLWRVMFPMFRSQFGTNGVLTVTSSTVVKNEPF